MNYLPAVFIACITLQAASWATPTPGILAIDTRIPIVSEGKHIGFMMLKAGAEVSILQLLPNHEGVLISRGDSEPAIIPAESLSPVSLQRAATNAEPSALTPTPIVGAAVAPSHTTPTINAKEKDLCVYPPPPECQLDNSIMMSVNGLNVPVLKWTTGKNNVVEYRYSRFALSGAATVKVTWNKPIESCHIQPSAFGIDPHINGAEATFDLPGSRYFILTINQISLLVLCDPPSNQARYCHGTNTNILSSAADRSGQQNCTAALQAFIDSIGSKGGGVAYIPCGIYKVGPFRLRSNVTLYLDDGAILKFDPATSSVPKDFGKVIHRDHERIHSGLYFIKADDAENIRIAGRGIIDLNGGVFFETAGWLNSCMRIQNVQNFEMEGVTIRENSSWSILIAGCNAVHLQNVKVLNGMGFEQNDAFDIISSQNVRIEHSFAYARDDSYCLKGGGTGTHGGGITTLYAKNFGNITVRDCVAYTRDGSGFKIGNQSTVSGNDFACKDLYAIAGRNAVFLALFDGAATFQHIRIDNIFIDQKEMVPFKVEIKKGGQVKDLSVTNVLRKGQQVPIRIAPTMQAQ